MIKINDIITEINNSFKTHYFKDITTYKIAELITREDSEGNEITRPAIYTGKEIMNLYKTTLRD